MPCGVDCQEPAQVHLDCGWRSDPQRHRACGALMKMSTRGRKLLTEREGLRLEAYKDSVGVWTIGIGHTSMAGNPPVMPGLKITSAQADDILTRDLERFENIVNNSLFVPVAQNEFDALVSICFNVGPKFAQSTCIKKLNVGDREGAAEAIMLWNKPAEIIGRRRSEYQQFKTPYQGMIQTQKPASATPVIVGGAAAGAGAAAQQAGLPIWAVALVMAGVGLA